MSGSKEELMCCGHEADLPDVNDCTLTLVRGLGFDSSMCAVHGSIEKVFFLGPYLMEGRDIGAHATEEAIKEFIDYYEHQIQVAKDYLASGRNNRTDQWAKHDEEEPCANT